MLDKRRKRRRLLLIVVILALGAVIAALYNRETILPQYIEETTEEEKNELDITFESVAPVKDENFRIYVPVDMRRVDDDNNAYFLSDTLNITVSKLSYTHEISLYTADTFASTLSGDVNMLFFNYPTSSSRLLAFRRADNNSDTVTVMLSLWDRKNIINISYEIDFDLYSNYLPAIRKSIDSYTWDTEYEISDYLYMAYNKYGNCDYAIPVGFKNKSNSNMCMYTNDNGSIVMTLEIYENTEYLDKINNIAYTEYAGKGKSGYSLRNYNVTKDQIVAESSYVDNNTNSTVYMYQKVVATGSKQYFITYYVDSKSLNDTVLGVINNTFIYFNVR